MGDRGRNGLTQLIAGIACVLLALLVLVSILELWVHRAAVCYATQRCHVVGLVAVLVGLVGVALLFRRAAIPSRH